MSNISRNDERVTNLMGERGAILKERRTNRDWKVRAIG